MKKIILLVLSCLMITGCNSKGNEDKIQIVTTVYPVYDWLLEICPDEVEVTYLTSSGIDLHNYTPTANDIIKINESDLFVYIGGHSEGWVEDVLGNDIENLKLLDLLGDRVLFESHDEEHSHDEDEEHSHDEDEEHSHDEDEDEEHSHSHEDEHIWMSLTNASILVEAIGNKIIELNLADEDVINSNVVEYTTKLNDLDQKYVEVVSSAKNDTVIVADRFSLVYLFEDYNINYHAAFSGCSSETEASFETVMSLIEEVKELSLEYVLIIEGSNQNIALSIINEVSYPVEAIEFNSMQSITLNNLNNETSYLTIMESNLDVLNKILN